MKKSIVLIIYSLSLLMGTSLAQKPNIIWIFSDDHSYQTIGAYGGRFEKLNPTPNIDKLAEEGMRFDRCYVENSICAPSRATLLTGKLCHIHKKIGNGENIIFDHNQQQFQKMLQQNGYQTAIVGKIHFGGQLQGFDHQEMLISQGYYFDPLLVSEEGKTQYKGYTTDILTDKSINWLEEKRDKDKPFMLMLHHKAPHRAWFPEREHMDMYEDVIIPEPDNLHDDYSTRTTAAHIQRMTILDHLDYERDLKMRPTQNGNFLRKGADDRFDERREKYKDVDLNTKNKELTSLKYQVYLKDYLRCIWSVDENVGRIMSYLKESGLDKNTIVMYSSDQGFYMGEHGWFDKRFMYEESYRTPLIVKWPGVVKPGSVNSDLVQNIDFAETFLDICGAPIPDDMQGKSIVPLLKNKTPRDWRKSLYYHYYGGGHVGVRHEGVSTKRYKLIRFYGSGIPDKGEEWEFYDLKTDPSEMNNMYDNEQYYSKIKELREELKRLRIYYKVENSLNVNPKS